MQQIFIPFNGRYPSNKAAAIFAAKTAQYFASEGKKVTLIASRRWHDRGDPFEFYAIQKSFNLIYVPSFQMINSPFLKLLSFYINLFVFTFFTMKYLNKYAGEDDVIYTTENHIALKASKKWITCIEIHDLPGNKKFFYKKLFDQVTHILVTNNWKLNKLKEMYPSVTGKSFVELNAVEISNFKGHHSKVEAEDYLNLPRSEQRVLYTGHLYEWKGVDTLAEAAFLLPDVTFYFVGGTKDDVSRFKDKYRDVKNIRIIGNRPHAEIYYWQKASDVLVLPNTAKEDISKYYTSPMKLFEYLASERPVVASNLPSVREIVDDSCVYFFEPDDHLSLTEKISGALNSDNGSKIRKCYDKALQHTWTKRVRRIINRIDQHEYKK